MNLDEKNELLQMQQGHDFQLWKKLKLEEAKEMRDMATQAPGAFVNEELRTWYAGMAKGVELAFEFPVDNQPVADEL